MMPVRTTVHLEERLAEKVRRLAPSRGVNRFINEAVAEKVEAIERQELGAAMIEGYIATNKDRDQIMADWEAVDLEDWPEWKE
jgi:metal-responsive CopG/Arc/MetJ family transcriptional regulator